MEDEEIEVKKTEKTADLFSMAEKKSEPIKKSEEKPADDKLKPGDTIDL